MRKFNFLTLFVAAILFAACAQPAKPAESSTTQETTQAQTPATAYYCPMKCEGDKTYPQPGICPKCNMDLVAVEQGESGTEESHEGHDHDHE